MDDRAQKKPERYVFVLAAEPARESLALNALKHDS
jgi:hypothetical protein